MRNHYGTVGDQSTCRYSNVRKALSYVAITAWTLVGIILASPLSVRAQTSVPGGLTDAQALVLLQALANGNGAGSAALSAAQMQLLSQYIQRESKSTPATGGINLAQAQTLVARGQTASASGVAQAVAPATGAAVGANAAGFAVTDKKPGTIRIGVVQPKAQMGQGNSGANVAEPLRTVLIQYLSGPALDVIPLNAMLPTQIEAEMKQKACDFALYSSISQKTNSGGLGMLKKAMPLASMIPMVGAVGGMAGAVASSAAGAAMSGAAAVSGSVKSKSEVTYEYRLMASGSSSPVLANSATAKAKQDGEDIVTPLIEKAAEAILVQVGGKK